MASTTTTTTTTSETRSKLVAKRDDALEWKKRYEADYGWNGDEGAQRAAAYYDGLVHGYEDAILLIAGVAG